MTIQELFEIKIYHGYILQLFLAEALFFPLLARREKFVLRLCLSFAVFALLSIVITNVIYHWLPSGLNSVTIFILSLGMGAACFKSSFKEVLFCFVGAQLLQNLSHNIENIVYLPFAEKISDTGWFFISVAAMAAVYVAAYFVIIRRFRGGKKISLQSYGILLIALFSMLFCYLIQFLFQVYGLDGIWVIRLPLILCDVIALILQFGLQGYKWKADENAELERFIAQENKYYDAMKENIDLINMKAHDLKHFISDIRGGKYDGDSGLAEIQEAVERYDQTANTGNKALDAVLNEKMYVCHKNGIAFSTMVQGAELAFMRLTDISSVFGNILNNAIEYEQTVPDEEKRCIMLKVFRKDNLLCIHAENYCTENLKFKDNLPVTTKGSTDYHGFGLKSVRYVVKKYGGNLSVGLRDNMFVVDIIMPVAAGGAK